METPTISSSRPRLKRVSVILGAKETILRGGKGRITSLPTSSRSFTAEEWHTPEVSKDIRSATQRNADGIRWRRFFFLPPRRYEVKEINLIDSFLILNHLPK